MTFETSTAQELAPKLNCATEGPEQAVSAVSAQGASCLAPVTAEVVRTGAAQEEQAAHGSVPEALQVVPAAHNVVGGEEGVDDGVCVGVRVGVEVCDGVGFGFHGKDKVFTLDDARAALGAGCPTVLIGNCGYTPETAEARPDEAPQLLDSTGGLPAAAWAAKGDDCRR